MADEIGRGREYDLIKLPKGISGASRITRARLDVGPNIPYGCGDLKYYAEAESSGRSIPLVIKGVKTEEAALAQIAMIDELERSGIPVPTTRRYLEIEGSRYIVFSDLRERGKYAVWSTSNGIEQLKPLRLGSNDIDVIREQLISIHQKNGGKFFIDEDAYFIRKPVGKLGNVQVVLGDFDRVYSKTNAPHAGILSGFEPNRLGLAEWNFIRVVKFGVGLGEI